MSDAELPGSLVRLAWVTDAELVEGIRSEIVAVVAEFDAWRSSTAWPPVGQVESLVGAVDEARASLANLPVGAGVDQWVRAASPLLNLAWPLGRVASVERLRRAAMWRPMGVRSARRAVTGSEVDPTGPANG